MPYLFKNKIAVITGGAQGIGLATAQAFAKQGATVIIADYNQKQAEISSHNICSLGGKAIAMACDVCQENDVRAMIERVIHQYGKIDAAFNNAGIQSPPTDIADLSSEEYDNILNTNLKGVWLSMKYELQYMRQQGYGTIVNCSSLGGLVGGAGRAAYHAAKHGILGLTKSAALEYATKNIRINAICPGTIDTPMVDKMYKNGELIQDDLAKSQPIGRLGRPEEIADSVIWLSSPFSSFVIGQAISIDGGYTVQ